MKSEHEQGPAKSWIGPFIVATIDELLLSRKPKGQETHGGHCINLTDMIIAPLVIEKVPEELLEHLKIEFVVPKSEGETAEDTDENLRQINELLTTEFGWEVLRRLKLSIEEEKVQRLPHN
jgi:hypothetical protein